MELTASSAHRRLTCAQPLSEELDDALARLYSTQLVELGTMPRSAATSASSARRPVEPSRVVGILHTTAFVDPSVQVKAQVGGNVPLTWAFLVELPGIEPAAKGRVTCGRTEFDYAKRRETT